MNNTILLENNVFNNLITTSKPLLLNENFDGFIKCLYKTGFYIEKNFLQVNIRKHKDLKEEKEKNLNSLNSIQNRINNLSPNPHSKSDPKNLNTRLWHLLIFLIAWDDPGLRDNTKKKERQALKLKKHIDLSYRRAIHIGLIAEIISIQKEINDYLLSKNSEENIKNIDFKSTDDIATNKKLIDTLTHCIDVLQSEPPDSKLIFKNAAKAISSFKPFADKFLHSLGVFIGAIAALGCGVITGGFIFLLLSSVGAPLFLAIPISLLMFSAGIIANFPLFSKHSSEFLLSMAKGGGITEFINQKGKREQLSTPKKILLLFAAFFSIAVGLDTAALTIMGGTKIMAVLFPSLVILCPPLSGIIIGTLVSGLLIGLSFVMFRAFLSVLQSQFSFRDSLQRLVDEIKRLSLTQKLIYTFKTALKVAFIGFALFGLFFLCFTGIPSLATTLGPIISQIVGWGSFIGDLPFTIVTIITFCGLITSKLFSTSMQTNLSDQNNSEVKEALSSLPKNSLFINLFKSCMLVLNAIGRSISIFNGSVISAMGAVACCISAFAGTLIKKESDEESLRNQANDACIALLNPLGQDKINYHALERNNSISSFFASLCSTSIENEYEAHEKKICSQRAGI